MKKLLIIIGATLIITSSAFGTYTFYGECVETKCDLCNQRIYSDQEPSLGPYMPSVVGGGGYCRGVRAEELHGLTITVCPECMENYNLLFRQNIIDWVEKIRTENADLIKKNDKEARQYHIDKMREQVDEQLKQLEELIEKNNEAAGF